MAAGYFPLVSRSHELLLMGVVRQERAEELAWQEAAEVSAHHNAQAVAACAELREVQLAEQARAAAAADQAEARRAAERADQMAEYRTMLLAAGHRPRTVTEVLAAAAGMPPVAIDTGLPVPPGEASPREVMIGGEPLTRSVPVMLAGEPEPLLERPRRVGGVGVRADRPAASAERAGASPAGPVGAALSGGPPLASPLLSG